MDALKIHTDLDFIFICIRTLLEDNFTIKLLNLEVQRIITVMHTIVTLDLGVESGVSVAVVELFAEVIRFPSALLFPKGEIDGEVTMSTVDEHNNHSPQMNKGSEERGGSGNSQH